MAQALAWHSTFLHSGRASPDEIYHGSPVRREKQAKAALFLTNHGVAPATGERILDTSSARRLSALMLTCGTYDATGDFVYRVGLPAKSGVGRGIVAVLPGEMAVCVWLPRPDSNGNSLAGVSEAEFFCRL